MDSGIRNEISRCVKTYKTIASTPIAIGAKILPAASDDALCIYTMWTSQDFVEYQRDIFFRAFVIKKESFKVFSSGIPIDVGSILLHAFSKSGRKQAILREKNSPKKNTYLEIWDEYKKEATFDMTERIEHGKVIVNDPFKCFEWSSDEKFILYTAEEKQPKSMSYFADTSETKRDVLKGKEYSYREDWGEGCVGIHHTILCILEIETGLVQVLPTDKIGSDISFGQARWGPNDETVIFIGWTELPYRLCVWRRYNRRNALYSINLESEDIERLTPDDNINVRSPSFNPNMDTLIYLENLAEGTHFKGAKLQKYNWKTKKTSTVVDLVEYATGDDFPGIYTHNLPPQCWSEDGKCIYFSTVWRSREVILCVDVESGQVQKVQVDEKFGSAVVLDVQYNFLVVTLSAPNIEPCLVVGEIDPKNRAVITWKYLDLFAPVIHFDVEWNIKRLLPTLPNEKYPDLDFEIVVISPSKIPKKCHLIVMPHDGPHWCSPIGFQYKCIGFVKLGYILCLVNFRGSAGFGENNLYSLLGNIGTQDVADVQQSALYVKNNCGFNIGDIFVTGLGHGGFLAAHMCGQYPDLYKAAALLNPILDISNLIGISNMPDWAGVESGLYNDIDFSAVVKPDQLKEMWKKSPISHLENIRAPILFLHGKKDLNIPMSQSVKFYQVLKARNVPVRMYQYDDNHELLQTAHDGHIFIQACLWFHKYSS